MLAAGALYLVATLAFTYPVLCAPAQRLAPDLQDPVESLWILWWSAGHVPFTRAWWDAPAFHPTRDVLPLSFDLGGREARYVRLRQLAADVVSWNVAELELLGGAE